MFYMGKNKRQFLIQTCFLNPIPSLLYLSPTEEKKVNVDLLEKLLKTKPPFFSPSNPKYLSYSNYYWFLYCLMGQINHQVDEKDRKRIENMICWKEFNTLKNNFKNWIRFENNVSTVNGALKECEALLEFQKENRELFISIYDDFRNLFNLAGEERIFNKFGIDALPILSPEFIRKIDPSKLMGINPRNFFETHYAYEYLELSSNYQNSLMISNLFLDNANKDYLSSLANGTCILKKHFTDVIFKSLFSLFMNNNLKKAFYIYENIPEFYSWAIIGIFSKRMSDKIFISKIILEIVKFLRNDSICSDLIFRFYNDFEFFRKLSEMTGRVIEQSDFLKPSIPFYFLSTNILFAFDKAFLNELTDLKLFSISDNDRLIDCNFMNSYFAFTTLLEIVNTNDIDKLDILYNKIETNLVYVKNQQKRNKLIEDLFSMLFIKDSTNSYVLTNTKSQRLISIFILYANEPILVKYIRESLKKVQMLRCIIDSESLESSLMPTSSLLCKALLRGDSLIAKSIAFLNPDLKSILNLFQIVHDYYLSDLQTFTPNKNDSLCLDACNEISLSFRNEIEAFKYSIENNPNNEVKKVIKKRYDNRNEDIMSPFKKPLKIDCIKQIHFASAEWKQIQYQDNDTPFLSSFIDYLNKLMPILFKANISETIFEALSIPLQEIISKLLINNNIDDAIAVANSFKTDIVEYALKTRLIDKNMIKKLLESYPIVDIAYSLFQEGNTIDLSKRNNISKVLKNYIKKEQNDDNKKDSLLRENYDSLKLLSYIEDLLNSNKIDYPTLIDLSYRVSPNKFEEIVTKHLPSLDLRELSFNLNLSGCDFEFIDKISILAEIQKLGISPFPLNNSFSYIVANHQFKLAKRVLEYYLFDINVVSILRKEVLVVMKQNQVPNEILNICPSKRKEIIDSLPLRFITIFEQEDSNNSNIIPKEWKPSLDPITLLKKNMNDVPNVVKYLSTQISIDFDIEFISIMKTAALNKDCPTSETIIAIHNVLHDFNSVFRNHEKVFQSFCKIMVSFVDRMNIIDGSSELNAYRHLILIRNALTECKSLIQFYHLPSGYFSSFNETYKTILCITDFVRHSLNSRYNIQYSFSNFHFKTFAEKINAFCYDYDLPELASKIAAAWHIKDNKQREKYSIKCFSLGKFETGLYYAPNRRRTTSITSAQQSEEFSSKMISIFSRVFFYEPEMIMNLETTLQIRPFLREFTNTLNFGNPNINKVNKSQQKKKTIKMYKSNTLNMISLDSKPRVHFDNLNYKPKFVPSALKECDLNSPHFYSRIVTISQGRITSCPEPIHSKMLRHFLRTNSKIGDQVKYFVSCGNFKKAFKYMMMQTTAQAKWNIFFDYIIIPAYSYNYTSRMKYRIKTDDPELKQFGSYFEKLLQFALKYKMPHLQLDIELILERTETAAKTAYKLALSSSTLKESLTFLECSKKALDLELSGKHTIKKPPNEFNPDELKVLKVRVCLLLQFCQYCVQNNFNELSITLFHSKESIETTVVFLLKQHQFNMAYDIYTNYNLSIHPIANKLTDLLFNEDDQTIISFIEKIMEFSNLKFSESLISLILMRLFYVHQNQDFANYIISHAIKDPDFKCRLLVQFMNIEDAFQIAKTQHITHLLPLIGNIAQSKNLAVIVNDVTRILSKQ